MGPRNHASLPNEVAIFCGCPQFARIGQDSIALGEYHLGSSEVAFSRMQNAMFGRPDWFKTRTISVRTPSSLMGWLYLMGWGAAITVPTWMFLDARRAPEALSWLAISSLALLWDRRHSQKAAANASAPPPPPVIASTPEIIHTPAAPAPVKAETESPFYISDAPPDITFVAERTRQSRRNWMPWARRFRV
jgi:hypothetical protein